MVKGFSKQDFDVFHIDGLDERMEAIQQRIQPKFRDIGNELCDHLAARLGNEMYLHIAKHARRTVNPPDDTWLAVADNKRGYKKHPHFQVGLFDSHVFIWLACIYELDGKHQIAKAFLEDFDAIEQLPRDFVVSLDHTNPNAFGLSELKQSHLERFRDVKKTEFLIGRHLPKEDERLSDPQRLMETIFETVDDLTFLYRKAMQARAV